jgi:hypothetical protein
MEVGMNTSVQYGYLVARVPVDVVARVKQLAVQERRSRSQMTGVLIEKGLAVMLSGQAGSEAHHA